MNTLDPATLPPCPAGMKMFCLSVKTRRVVTTLPLKKVQTAPAEWLLGHLPGVSAMHAIKVCWDNLPHRKVALLDQNGNPLAHGPMKRKEIIAREVLSRNVTSIEGM